MTSETVQNVHPAAPASPPERARARRWALVTALLAAVLSPATARGQAGGATGVAPASTPASPSGAVGGNRSTGGTGSAVAPTTSRPATDTTWRRWLVDWQTRTALGFELGLGSVITPYSVGGVDSASLMFTGLKATYDLDDPWSVEVMFRQWWLSGSNQVIVLPAVGGRVEPYRDQAGRAHFEASLGIGWTSHGTGIAFDLGGGFEFDLPSTPGLGLGPFLRYGQVTSPDSASDRDGRAWLIGVSVQYHLGRAAASRATERTEEPGSAAPPPRPYEFKVPDTDNDGVTDESDQCKTVPAGKRPDVYRPGCPEDDTDEDGVPDSEDACPLAPAGATPDPKWPGCPFADADKDGIPDLDDHCPSQPGNASDDPNKNGCPEPAKKTAPPRGPAPAAPATTRKGAVR